MIRHWPIGVLYDFHTAHAGLSHVSPGTPSLSSPNFFTAPSLRTTASFSSSVSEKTVSAIANTTARYHHATRPGVVPWRLTLHLKDPPMEALLMDGGVEACRTGFMNMLKVRSAGEALGVSRGPAECHDGRERRRTSGRDGS